MLSALDLRERNKARSDGKKTAKGTRVMPSLVARKWYGKRLSVLAKFMHKKTVEAFKGKKAAQAHYEAVREAMTRLFNGEAEEMATKFILKNIRSVKAGFAESVNRMNAEIPKSKERTTPKVKLDARKDKREVELMREAIAENVALISSIPSRYYDKISTAVERVIRGRMTQSAFAKRLVELGGISERRARMIAADQTVKATERLVRMRCERNGIDTVMWKHTGRSKKPREYHRTLWDGHTGKRNGKPNGLNGYVFKLSNPPVIDRDTGEVGYTGQLINCTCTMIPVMEVK